MHDENIPYGYCECGCGKKTALARQTQHREGAVKGEPRRFLRGHNKRDHGNYVVAENGCWIWQGCLNGAGYGPHRRYYKRAKGSIPKGLDLDHLCRTRACVNPDHLEAVTTIENNRRAAKLTEADVLAIRAAVPTYGYRWPLAKKYGIAVDTITAIRGRRTWR